MRSLRRLTLSARVAHGCYSDGTSSIGADSAKALTYTGAHLRCGRGGGMASSFATDAGSHVAEY